MSHTPGPWHWEGERVLVEPGLMLYERLSPPTENGGTPAPVLCVNTYGDELCIDKADARLIAAAPELLEALSTILQTQRQTWGYLRAGNPSLGDVAKAVERAHAAIAKATGEGP